MHIPNGYAQVNLRITGDNINGTAEVTFGVAKAGGLSVSDVNDLVKDAWDGALMTDCLDTACTVQSALIKFGPNATGASAEFTWASDGTGSGPGDGPMVSMLIKKVTDAGGRTGRGRMYLPAVPAAYFIQGGIIESSVLTVLQTKVDNFLSGLDSNVVPMVLLHAEGSPISTPTVVTGLVVAQQVATQRRRNRR